MAQVVEALGETGGQIKVEVAENTRQFGKYLGQQGEALGEYYRNARAENPLLVGIPAEIFAGFGTFMNLAEEGFKEIGEKSLEELFGEAAAQELIGKGREVQERVRDIIDRNIDPDQKRAVMFAVSVATLGSLVKQGIVAVGKEALELKHRAFKGKSDRASTDSGVEAPRVSGQDDLPAKKTDLNQGKLSQGYVDLEDPNTPLLRKAYIIDVHKIADEVKIMRDAGKSSEEIARHVHKLRRDIGERYKDLTPPELREKIYKRNIIRYGDKLGPSIEKLRLEGKSWEDIIDSATRTGDELKKIMES